MRVQLADFVERTSQLTPYTELKPEMPAYRATDDRRRKAMTVVKRFCILHLPILLDHLCNVTVPLEELSRCIGAPLLETHTRFHMSTTYGESLEVQTEIEEWRGKVFIQRHSIMCGETLIC